MKVCIFYNSETLDLIRFEDFENHSSPKDGEKMIIVYQKDFDKLYSGSLSDLTIGHKGPFSFPDIRKKITSLEAEQKYYEHGYVSYNQFLDSVQHSTHYGPTYDKFLGWKVKNEARLKLIFNLLNNINESFDYFEFGVHKGDLFKAAVKTLTDSENRFYGFDTFEGMPEDWITTHGNQFDRFLEKGEIDATLCEVEDSRTELIKGLFQDTLLPFLQSYNNRRKFIIIDSDIYSSALFLLTTMHPYLQSGDIVYFDEFIDDINEFQAFNDYIRSYYMKDRFQCIGKTYQHFAFRIL